MPLSLYSTLTRRLEPFGAPDRAGIYLCGPTVYMESHVGHAVGPVIVDALKRFLEFNGIRALWVVNITDIDDKLIRKSAETGASVREIADRHTALYRESLARLGISGIDHFPRATDHVDGMHEMISGLVAKGLAYASGGDVYFDVRAFLEKKGDYGSLSNRQVDEMEGEGGTTAARKKSPLDFALWKAAKPGEPQWQSPWGPGRPGWHIECSVMARRYLGDTLDVHAGGLDLVFPHHENERAQSEAATGKPFARFWMHNGLVRLKGEKMSKSLGNLVPLHRLLDEMPGEALRFFLLSTHYRSPIDFASETLAASRKGLEGLHRTLERARKALLAIPDEGLPPRAAFETLAAESGPAAAPPDAAEPARAMLAALDDDFNTGAATGHLFRLSAGLNRILDANAAGEPAARAARLLRLSGLLLGIFREPLRGASDDTTLDALVAILAEERASARQRKDFAAADAIRTRLLDAGIVFEDRKGQTAWRRK